MIHLSKPMIGADEIEAVTEVLQSGMIAAGALVAQFETEFAEAIGTKHGVAVGSGTAALYVGLMAMRLGPGDEVIVPSHTFAASANSIAMTGATPVFADVDPEDYTIHASNVEPLISGRTRAVMPVHLYGQMAPMDELRSLAEETGIEIYEDSAQAHMAESDGVKAGAWGRAAGFSFYPTKNMTTGEGGMITTSDDEVAERARWFRNQGMEQRYVHRIVGLNERMTEIEAAIGMVQLEKLPVWTERRREIASRYREELNPALNPPVERSDTKHVYHQFTLAPPDRRPVIEALSAVDIGHDVYYPRAAHQQEPYSNPAIRLPVTEDLVERVVSIPVRPSLTDEEVGFIIRTLNAVDIE